MPLDSGAPSQAAGAIACRVERESNHAGGKVLPLGRGTTRRRDVKDIGRGHNNFNWHAACKLYSHYEESDVFLA
jgi:hypothetical protein